ncbi:apolipophorins-like [Pollicipes pollicipes]|uniref:apolipophorins-like n=1 Tax=Pollicipes pollicipes TaxID=41117 RepID=UPI001884C9F6|nr:apolipophorins-like [Pollicipes pollicipes]
MSCTETEPNKTAVTNLFKYSKMLLHWLYEKFGLVDVFGEPGRWLKDFWDNPPASLAKAKDTITLVYHQLAWTVDHLGVADFFQRTMAKIYREGDQFWTQTAIEGAQRYFEGKSMMVMRPERGYISFVQILPMPWYGFYQSPVWEELPELQKIRRIRSLTKSSDWTLYDIAIAYWPGSNPMEWVPPFKGHAVLSGSSTFVTFDGRLYSFQADCTYLLAADLLDDRFAVEATFRRHGSVTKTISVTAGGHTIRLGGVDGFRITADDQPAEAPLDLGELRVTRAGDTVSVLLPGWMELHCNQGSDVCSLEISRWLFGRTGGLFGTHDNEPYTDLESPDHLRASGALFASSWALHKCRRPAHIVEPGAAAPETVSVRTAKRSDGFCWGLLGAPQSEYRACHRLVDPAPFLTACQQQGDENRCVAVRAYVEACRHRGWPLKMPNKCVQCEIDGKPVFEGRTVRVQGETPATEVVFIVEAKQCNANITARRSIGRLVNSLSIALRLEKFATTKFAVVVFGGDGVQDQPQVLTVNGQIFSRAKRTVQAFRQIKPGSGGRDVFGALRRAAMLPFSAGVSRTFILMPCSACEASAMSIDYTTLANAFAEQQITLHVIMDGDLSVSKKKGKLLGIDRNKAWTLKDAKKLVGDAALLKHVRTPKAQLKLCEPLATRQTQGAIFSSSKLTPHPRTGRLRMRQLKKWMLVFGKRVALTARPQSCQNCECAADVEGTARFECMPCSSVPLLPSDLEDDIFYSDDA